VHPDKNELRRPTDKEREHYFNHHYGDFSHHEIYFLMLVDVRFPWDLSCPQAVADNGGKEPTLL